MAICARCHGGLIRSRAAVFDRHGQESRDVELPRQFWWAEGHEALEQNWDVGDFSTWIDSKEHWRAYGVRFALDDLLKLIPFEEQGVTRLRLSVAGNPTWASAREAQRFAYNEAQFPPVSAGSSIIAQCRLGFILARAVEMQLSRGSGSDDWTSAAREWDVPTWFWDRFTVPNASTQDWEQGKFSGRGRSPDGQGLMRIHGVHFLRSSLQVLMPPSQKSTQEHDSFDPPKPNLAEADLLRWWQRREAVREALSQNDLWTLAKADHPEHTVSRDRIRGLAENRKPGPKGN